MTNLPSIIEPHDLLVTASPHPFKLHNETRVMLPGVSLAQILSEIQPDALLCKKTHIWVNDKYVEPDKWGAFYPEPGANIAINVVPQGGGIGRIIGTIFIAIAAIAVAIAAPYALAALGVEGLFTATGALSGWGLFASGMAGMVVGVVGNLVLNALCPPVSPSSSKGALPMAGLSALPGSLDYGTTSNTLSITGASNKENKYGPVPFYLGKHKTAPPYGARTYTESIGNEQYLRLLFVWGYGPVKLESLKIGQTPIANFQGVEMQHANLVYDGATYNDTDLTLYPLTIHEEALAMVLEYNTEVTHTSETDADEISVDVTCPNGLLAMSADGSTSNYAANFTVLYRETGTSGAWLTPSGVNSSNAAASTIAMTANSKSSVRESLKWTVARGQYDVKIKRTTAADDIWHQSISYWTALRSIQNEDPIADFPYPLAKTAMRIKATGQLNGTVDEFNAIVTGLWPSYDAGTDAWVDAQETQNPADLFVAVLQGSQNAKALTDSRIDWDKIETWHADCVTNGYKYNKVIDYQATIKELLDEIAAAGRASFTWIDSKAGVFMDRVQTYTKGPAFTPRNILKNSFSSTLTYPDLPHAFRVQFMNEDQDYQQDERIVLDDGYQINDLDAWGVSHPEYPEATLFELLELPGVTNDDLIFQHARYHIATARLRPETIQFSTDIEWLVATRGDRIKFAHDAMLVGLSWGRVTAVQTDESDYISGITLDEEMPMEGGKSYTLRFRLSDNTSVYAPINTIAGVLSEADDDGNQYYIYAKTVVFTTPINPNTDPYPAVGDLALFGEATEEALDLIIKSIRPNSDLSAVVTCVEYNEDIYDADQGTIPAHDSHLSTPSDWLTPVVSWVRSDGTVLLRDTDGSWKSRILLSLTVPSALDALVTGVECRYWTTNSIGVVSVLPMTRLDDGEVSITPVEDGVEYSYQLRYVKRDGSRGPWTTTATHTVEGKTAPPADVTGFMVMQVESIVTAIWSAVADRDLAGYEVRYGAVACTWAEADVVNGTYNGTTFSTTNLPPGAWDILIKAIDTSGNYSDAEARKTFQVFQFYSILSALSEAPLWAGTLTNLVRNPLTGHLNPDDQDIPDGDDFDVFDNYVVNPFEAMSYEPPEVDLLTDEVVRLWSRIYAAMGPGETSSGSPQLSIDYKLDGGAYDGFEDWTVGFLEARYVKSKITMLAADGLRYLSDMQVTMDQAV